MMIVKVGSLTVKVTFEIRIVCVIEVIQYNLSKVDTCQKWTKDFAPKYQFTGLSLTIITCLRDAIHTHFI